MNLTRGLLILLLLLLNGSALAKASVILVYGDSLSAAYGIDQQKSWPALLQQQLAAQGYRHRVVNASISGETTAGGLARLPALLERHQPSIVVIALGANDGLRGLPLISMYQNLKKMSRLVKASKAVVLMVGLQLPGNYGKRYTEQFHRVYDRVTMDEQLVLQPFMMAGFTAKRHYFLADGLHPGELAQPLILDNVWSALMPLLD